MTVFTKKRELYVLCAIVFVYVCQLGVSARLSCKRAVRNLKLAPHTRLAWWKTNFRNIKLFCDKGYLFPNRKSKAIIKCRKGVLPNQIPACRGCDNPKNIANGMRVYSKVTIGSKVTYSCNAGYTLVGKRQRRCQRNLKWSGKRKPFCRRLLDYSECGIPHKIPTARRVRRVVGGQKTKGTTWPWAVRLYTNDRHHCGGTIVNEQFILTAATCVYGIKRQDVTAVFGNGDKTPSKFIYKHPHYDSRKFTNDIAMIRIKKLKRFTRKKQAICLPRHTDITKVTGPGHTMFVVGWGTTKRFKLGGKFKTRHMSNVLKEVQLPFIADKMCEKNVQKLKRRISDAYFTNATQFCAGDKTGKSDTCSGDSGGPAMVLARDTQSRPKWYQVGIVSWGVGCAQKGEFGYYTKVSSFLPWINQIIRNHSV